MTGNSSSGVHRAIDLQVPGSPRNNERLQGIGYLAVGSDLSLFGDWPHYAYEDLSALARGRQKKHIRGFHMLYHVGTNFVIIGRRHTMVAHPVKMEAVVFDPPKFRLLFLIDKAKRGG